MNDNISGMAMTPTSVQRADTDNQDDVHYTSIHFSGSNNQEVPLYSTVQLPQTQKEDEDVQYAVVKFNRPSAAPPVSKLSHYNIPDIFKIRWSLYLAVKHAYNTCMLSKPAVVWFKCIKIYNDFKAV